eukprot:TRINITY_DN1038_c0_g1_i1.p1 TRINITY_DN1038_c0_g1~~TRINITY_DN1038_c0_g1_i1.p1  ORF type:complete len:123 (+),score=11.14 TRINITY_DN1038_c0_g1_i1:37-405(+)
MTEEQTGVENILIEDQPNQETFIETEGVKVWPVELEGRRYIIEVHRADWKAEFCGNAHEGIFLNKEELVPPSPGEFFNLLSSWNFMKAGRKFEVASATRSLHLPQTITLNLDCCEWISSFIF